MKTGILLPVVLLALVLPWVILLTGDNRTVGMYASENDTVLEGDSDVYDCLWHFSWIRESRITDSDPRDYFGRTLAWHNMAWPSLFMSWIFGTGYHLSLLVSSLLTGLAGYFLARSWGVGKNGAILAGLIMVWMPVRLVRMYQHYQIASVASAVFTLGMIRKWITDGKLSFLILAFVFSAVAVMECFQHGVTIALGWLITMFLSGWKGWGKTALSGAVIAAGCAAGALWLLLSPGMTAVNPGMDWRESVYWGAELQSYFLPSILGNPLTAGYMPNIFEGVVSPGLTVLVLALVYCIREKQWKAALAAALVMILSVGPLFKLGGTPTSVPLPYMIIAKLPWLSAARTPARLGILAGFAAALGAGSFIERRGKLAGWLLTAVILLEITPVQLQTINSYVPQFYHLAEGESPVLEIPASPMIRKYSLFESFDMIPRRVKFLSRGGETFMEGIPEGLTIYPDVPPVRTDLQRTGAGTVVYNRWIFQAEERAFYDSLYSSVFTESEKGDSLWIWRAQ